MKMRKSRTLVICPPVSGKGGALWLAGFALLGHLGIAVWAAARHPLEGRTAAAALVSPWTGSAAPAAPADGRPLVGRATWYGAELHGNPTASGEPFDMNGLTAAHRTLPLGSRARVTNLTNGRQVVVRINDRGPGRSGVMIDLSRGAADAIGMAGSAEVEVQPLAR
jgi:rare lipoprotein A